MFAKDSDISEDRSLITNCLVYCYELAETLDYDLVIGNNQGDLGLFSFG